MAPLKNPYELKHLCFSWWCRYICQCDSAAPRGVCELARTLLDYFASRGSSTAAYLHQLCDGIFVFGGIGRRCKQGRGEEVKKLEAISGRVRASLRNDIIDRRKRAYLIGRWKSRDARDAACYETESNRCVLLPVSRATQVKKTRRANKWAYVGPKQERRVAI